MDVYFDRTTNGRCSKSFGVDIDRVTETFDEIYKLKLKNS